VETNLAPQAKKSLIKQFSQFSSLLRKKSQRPAWGIDLNAWGLRAVKLGCDDQDGAPVVLEVAAIKHRKLLSHPDAQDERGVIAAETLRAFVEQHPTGDAKNIANMPSQKLLGRFFDLPPLEPKKVPEAVIFEARHQIPFTLESLAWDYDLIEAGGKPIDTLAPRRVVLVAGRDFHIQERLAIFNEASVAIDALVSDCLALHNFLAAEFFSGARDDAPPGVVVAVDVGAECTNLVMTSPSVQWFRTLNLAGHSFTEPLVRQFKLTYTQAELLKREPFRARRLSQLYATFDPLLAELATEIARSLDSFQKLYPSEPLAHLYGLGGGFVMHGLLRRLRIGR
jgi:type IV pilus assembly protein PilM